MSGVNDASIAFMTPLAILLAVLSALVLAGLCLWLVVRRLRGKQARGRSRMSFPGGLETAAIILLLIGGFFFLVGWVVGAVLLWVSPRWRLADKLLGTLVWPGGLSLILYAGPFTTTSEACSGGTGIPTRCTWQGPPVWVGTMALVLILLGQLATTVWLWWRATRHVPGHDAGGASVTPVS